MVVRAGNTIIPRYLSDDRRTLVIKPVQSFTPGEMVTVRLDDQIKTESGIPIGPFQYSFTVSPTELPPPPPMWAELSGVSAIKKPVKSMHLRNVSAASNNSLPSTFPDITEAVDKVRPKWNIFLSNIVFADTISNTSYLMVLSTSAVPLIFKPVPPVAVDFKWQPTGRMTYYNSSLSGFLVLDSSYNPVDTAFCGNGYSTDLHDIRILPNGHTFLHGHG